MRIRKGFVAAHGLPISMAHQHHTAFLKFQDVKASTCVLQGGPDQAMGTERRFSDSIVDRDDIQCIAMGLNRTMANGSEEPLWGTQEHRKEDKGTYRISKGRCIMCGEAGHSCFQQLAMSRVALPVKYCLSKSAVIPMLKKVEDVERGKHGHSYCNIHDTHPDQIPESCHKKEPNGKTFTTTINKRPYTSVHNDFGIPGHMNRNETERNERNESKDSTVAGKQTQRIQAPNKIHLKSHASNIWSDRESLNMSSSSGKGRVMSKDSVLQSGMRQCVAETKFDLGNGKVVFQKLLNLQGHCDQFLEVSNASENLPAIKSFIEAKVDRQSDPVLAPASLYNVVAKDEGCRTKWSNPQHVEAFNLKSSADQEPVGSHDPGHRCKRMDGKGWQFLRKAEAGFSLCEYHLSKSRANHIRKKAAKMTKDGLPSEKKLSGRKKSMNKFSETTLADASGVVADPLPQAFKRQAVKARSITSIQ